MNKIRMSSSRLSNFHKCSFMFYCREVLGLSEGPTHPRTIIGSLTHSILECIKHPRHKHHYDIIKQTGNINNSKSIIRLIDLWRTKYNLSEELLYDINGMIQVAINADFFFEGAVKRFAPEHEFILQMDGYEIKGFIDDMAEYEDYILIRDYKTGRNKYTKQELSENFQSIIYQLYIYKKFGKLSKVNFLFLRHGPTVRTPDKHIQEIGIRSKDELEGFVLYLNHINKVFQNMGWAEATQSYCKDYWFCRKVCPFFTAHDYQAIISKNNLDKTPKIVRMTRMTEKVELKPGEWIEIRHFGGCFKYHGINNL